MIEGRDYYYEGPYQVMTEEFLLARGHCCDSNCRHCPYKSPQQSPPRVVSLVPSLTETLVACGIDVVGRTRYCIHPKDRVKQIPVVGGTKDLDFKKLEEIAPDFVLLDREENTKEMAEAIFSPIVTTHVRSLYDLATDLTRLAETFDNAKLRQLAQRVSLAGARPAFPLPDLLDWWTSPVQDFEQIVYMIWKDPWMCVSSQTFIGDLLSRVFPKQKLWTPRTDSLYPQVEWQQIPPKTLVLLSSEPYPFAKKKASLVGTLKHPTALVDGECFSWFGLRSLRFLEDLTQG